LTSIFQLPEPGQLVDVRQRRYVVLDIGQSTLPASMFAPPTLNRQRRHHLVTLSSVEDDALGEELQVIWEIEPGATPIEKLTLICKSSRRKLACEINAFEDGLNTYPALP
jgi:hypothetical protein